MSQVKDKTAIITKNTKGKLQTIFLDFFIQIVDVNCAIRGDFHFHDDN